MKFAVFSKFNLNHIIFFSLNNRLLLIIIFIAIIIQKIPNQTRDQLYMISKNIKYEFYLSNFKSIFIHKPTILINR